MTYDNIHYIGRASDRDDAIEILDQALLENGNFGQHGDFREGLEEITQWYEIEVTAVEDVLEVNMGPLGGGGEEFNFVVEKESFNIIDLVVVETPLEEEDDSGTERPGRSNRNDEN